MDDALFRRLLLYRATMATVKIMLDSGLISDEERYNTVIKIWDKATEDITNDYNISDIIDSAFSNLN